MFWQHIQGTCWDRKLNYDKIPVICNTVNIKVTVLISCWIHWTRMFDWMMTNMSLLKRREVLVILLTKAKSGNEWDSFGQVIFQRQNWGTEWIIAEAMISSLVKRYCWGIFDIFSGEKHFSVSLILRVILLFEKIKSPASLFTYPLSRSKTCAFLLVI